MSLVGLAILTLFILFFIVSIAAYIAIDGSLLGGVVMVIVIICVLLMANFLWKGE